MDRNRVAIDFRRERRVFESESGSLWWKKLHPRGSNGADRLSEVEADLDV